MKERDAAAVRALPRSFVYELDPGLFEAGEGGLEVGDAVGEVVEAGAASIEETGDGGIGRRGLEEFESAGAGADEGDLDALTLDAFGRGAVPSGQQLEQRHGVGDGGDGDRHVVEGKLVHSRWSLIGVVGGVDAAGVQRVDFLQPWRLEK